MAQQGLAAAPREARRGRFGSLPNILTYGRILAIPALVACFFVTGDWGRWVAMWIFIAAGVSDFFDGYLARAWQQQSTVGRMLDPIADKLIVAAALLMLAADQTIAGWSLWAGVIILCREILVSGLREFLGTLAYSGFWHMARKYWRVGAYEMYRSASKAAFVRSLQKLVPQIARGDLERGGAGVRAQAVAPDGSLVDDFKISVTPGAVHVVNAPSPAATASIAIGRHIATIAADTFRLTGGGR